MSSSSNWYWLCFKSGSMHSWLDASKNDLVERTMVMQKQKERISGAIILSRYDRMESTQVK